jgi:hypothetical protein
MLVGLLAAVLAGGSLWAAAPAGKKPAAASKKPTDADALKPVGPKREVNEDEVNKAIEAGREYLLKQAQGDGSFGKGGAHHNGVSALVFMTLAYMGQHPNHPAMSKGLDYLLNLSADAGFEGRCGYAVPIRIMGLAYIHNKLIGDRRTQVRQKMTEDVQRIIAGQNPDGGWRYKLDRTDYDFSVSQWPLLAFREANLVGIEFPTGAIANAAKLYCSAQDKDGGWGYHAGRDSYGSMTAAGLASLYIIADVLDPSSGCPCAGGRSERGSDEFERRVELALHWLGKNFSATDNPKKATGEERALYWLYCVERVGIAAGYKYFGTHNWFREGAARVLNAQKDGHWDSLEDTCFALLFLYKGRAPVLFNKLKFEGEWNAHRRDIANLTNFIERAKEQPFHWQIVDLKSSLEELHDAPILYITAETIPNFTEADAKKLRRFTDTGGTILFEASCGNAAVRKWFRDWAPTVWPEWRLEPLSGDHGVWKSVYDLKSRPEIMGISDGVRTCVFFAPDDVSCAWQCRAVAGKAYLFNWGINLYTYATDGAPIRSKLAARGPERTGRFKSPAGGGARRNIRIARVKYAGNWEVGANYGGFKALAEAVKSRSGITLDVKENRSAPVTEGGVPPAGLKGYDVAYLGGSADFTLTPDEQAGLKAFAEKGGFLWVESVTGGAPFDQAFAKAARDMGWELKMLPKDHPLMTGKMQGGRGYDLTTGVEFHHTLRVARLARPCADFLGIYAGDKMVGVYSPLDVVFSTLGVDAFQCRGYRAEDAEAVGTNLAVYISTLR